jgi:hypothetical protein
MQLVSSTFSKFFLHTCAADVGVVIPPTVVVEDNGVVVVTAVGG